MSDENENLSPPRPAATPGSGSTDGLQPTLERVAAALEEISQQTAQQSEGKDGGKKGEDEKNGGDKKEGEDQKKEGGDGQDKDGGENHKPSKKAIVIGILVVLLIVAVVLFLWLGSRGKVSTDDAYTTGHVHPVASRIAGTVESVDVDDNDLVETGQIIIHLDQRDNIVSRDKAAANLAQAEAQLTQAQAQVTQSEASILQAKAQVSQQRAQVNQAQVQLELARINFNRNRSLSQRDARAIAQSDVDTTQSNFGGQQAQLDAANANVQAGEANVQAQQDATAASRANVKVGEANVTAARAGLADAELQLSYCQIVAPVAGRISKKNVEAGQRLSVGQALLSVVPENIWVLANFKETQLEHITVGQRVDVEIDALPHHVFIGTVDSIQEGTGATFALLPSDNSTGNFTKIVQRVPVKIVFDEDSVRDFKDKIVPGLSVIPKIDLLSATPGKPAQKAQKREDKREQKKERQNKEREEGKI